MFQLVTPRFPTGPGAKPLPFAKPPPNASETPYSLDFVPRSRLIMKVAEVGNCLPQPTASSFCRETQKPRCELCVSLRYGTKQIELEKQSKEISLYFKKRVYGHCGGA